MKSQLKLQVGQARNGSFYWHKMVRGKITGHGSDYNTKAKAVKGILDDMCSSYGLSEEVFCDYEIDPEELAALRTVLKARIEFIS